MAEDAWLVAGLGNPGPRYAGNRHNAGFMVVDVLADRLSARFRGHRGRADVAEAHLAGRKAVLVRPRSYMNVSGGPVAAVSGFFKVPADRVVVIHDELDVAYGELRLKLGGGAGGHRGVGSVTAALGSRDFYRVRFGVGRPPGRMDPATYVLRDFSVAERKELGVHLERAADAVEELIRDGLAVTQNTYHAS